MYTAMTHFKPTWVKIKLKNLYTGLNKVQVERPHLHSLRNCTVCAFPVNMPDLIQKRFGYGQLWPLWPACSQNWAGSNFPHQSQLHFSKESLDHIVQNWPGSYLDGLVRFWPNGSGLEASWFARIIRSASGQCFPANLDWKQIIAGMFTVLLITQIDG